MLSLLRNSHRIYVEGLCMVFTVSIKLTQPFTSKKILEVALKVHNLPYAP